MIDVVEPTLYVGRVTNDPNPELTEIDFNKLAEFPLSDMGNAEAFIYLNRNTARYDHRYKTWFFWSPPLWRRDKDGRINRRISEMVRLRQQAFERYGDNKKMRRWGLASEANGRINAVRERCESMMPISTEGGYWDENDWLLGCENGLIDLREGKLKVGTQEDLVTLSTHLLYDENAECPRWLQFLDEVFMGNVELIDYIQRAFGYSLSGSTKEEIIFLCYGTGANGKSKTVNRIRDILGDYAWTTPFSTFANMERAGGATQEIAEMAWARSVIASESKESSKLNEARLKSLTGGEMITARFLYSGSFQFRPRLKIWMSANHKPQTEDNSHGFWRRIHLVPFEQQFTGKKQDMELEDKLHAEAQGILAWAVRGAVKWKEQGLKPVPGVVQAGTLEMQKENDMINDFVSNYLSSEPDSRISYTRAYEIFIRYNLDLGEKSPIPGKDLWRKMRDAGYKSKKTRDGYYWLGITEKEHGGEEHGLGVMDFLDPEITKV